MGRQENKGSESNLLPCLQGWQISGKSNTGNVTKANSLGLQIRNYSIYKLFLYKQQMHVI